MIPVLIRSYEASADVPANTIVKFSDASASRKVAAGAAATDPIIGVSDNMGAVSGGQCDVIRAGLGRVILGGTVQAGDPITSDASGHGIKCVGATGVIKRVVGWAEEPGVSGDIVGLSVDLSIIQLP